MYLEVKETMAVVSDDRSNDEVSITAEWTPPTNQSINKAQTGFLADFNVISTYTLADTEATVTKGFEFDYNVDITRASQVFTTIYGFHSHLDLTSTTPFTVTTHKGIYLQAISSNSTITSSYGIHVEDQDSSSTTAYGIYVAAQSGTAGYSLHSEQGMGCTGQAASPYSAVADTGGFWVKDGTPTTAWFTDSAGADHQLGVGSASLWTDGGTYLQPADDETVFVSVFHQTGLKIGYESDYTTNQALTDPDFNGFEADVEILSSSGTGGDIKGFLAGIDVTPGGAVSFDSIAAFESAITLNSNLTLTNLYGLKLSTTPASATVTNTYGVYQEGDTGYNYYEAQNFYTAFHQTGSKIGYESDYTTNQALTDPNFTGFFADVEILSSSGSGGDTKGFLAEVDLTPGAAMSFDSVAAFESDVTLNANVTLTNLYGLKLLATPASATVTNSYGVYQEGAADYNYYEGQSFHTSFHQTGSRIGYESDYTTNQALTDPNFTGFEADVEILSSSGSGGDIKGFLAGIDVTPGAALSFDSIAAFDAALTLNANATLTDIYGLHVTTTNVDLATVTNAYGIYLEEMHGDTLSYGIYQEGSGDVNYFAGGVTVGDSGDPSPSLLRTYSTATTGTVYGHTAQYVVSGVMSKPQTYVGFYGAYSITGSGAAGSIKGAEYAQVFNPGAALTIDDVTGVIESFNASSSVSVTNLYGFRVQSTSAPTITNSYGLYIEEMYGDTSSYGIYQVSSNDINYFAGAITVGNTADPALAKIRSYTTSVTGTEYSILSQHTISAAMSKPQAHVHFYGASSITSNGAAGSITGVELAQVINPTTGLTVDNVIGVSQTLQGSSNLTVSDYRGLLVQSHPSPTITDAYGVYIGEMYGDTNSYGIYQSSANDENYFAGKTGVGATADAAFTLLVSSPTVALLSKVDTTATTGSVIAASTEIDVNSGHTVGSASNMSISNPVGTGTISTTIYGLLINSQKSGPAAGVTNAWGVYQVGSSDRNYFAGITGIGATPSSPWSLYVEAPNAALQSKVLATAGGSSVTAISAQIDTSTYNYTATYGIAIGGPAGSGTVGTAYGLYISQQNSPASTGWGVYQTASTDKNYFNGQTGFGTNSIDTDALVEFSSTTKAVLLPRMTTTEMNNIGTPVNGMIIYNSTANKVYAYAGGSWVALH